MVNRMACGVPSGTSLVGDAGEQAKRLKQVDATDGSRRELGTAAFASMKKSAIFVGIEVVHAILDRSRDEGSMALHRYGALTLVVGKITGVLEAGPVESDPQVQQRLEKAGRKLVPLLADQRRLSPKVMVTRGLLLATPALFALAAPAVAKVVMAAARKGSFLKSWQRRSLPAPSPQLPPSRGAGKPPV